MLPSMLVTFENCSSFGNVIFLKILFFLFTTYVKWKFIDLKCSPHFYKVGKIFFQTLLIFCILDFLSGSIKI